MTSGRGKDVGGVKNTSGFQIGWVSQWRVVPLTKARNIIGKGLRVEKQMSSILDVFYLRHIQ